MLKLQNANPEYIVLVWAAMIQCHFRYGTFMYNQELIEQQVGKLTNENLVKLIIAYN